MLAYQCHHYSFFKLPLLYIHQEAREFCESRCLSRDHQTNKHLTVGDASNKSKQNVKEHS